jgi:hypothetical protein
MPITNPQGFLNQGVELPLAIEAVLPAGAPKISSFLVQVSSGLPDLPDFPAPLPDLPNFGITAPSGASLSSISVTAASPDNSEGLPIGAEQQFIATGTYSDGSTADITTQVTWTSSDITIATINADGLATGLAEGIVDITASLSGVTSPAATLTISTSGTITRRPITIIWD